MRRIAAVVLPDLACELVRQRVRVDGPLGVLFEPARPASDEDAPAPIPSIAVLDAVDAKARRYGVRAGQRVAEASALVSGLAVHRVTHDELTAALARAAEIALGLGPTAAIALESAAGPRVALDTVWLDITGAAHLVGGEDALLDELGQRIEALGHEVRAAIASGPQIAEAVARWSVPSGRAARIVVPEGREARAMAGLPIRALPVDLETASWLVRLGVLLVSDLARLPRTEATARLGARSREVLELASGHDEVPLVPYAPPRIIVEETSFEEGVESAEALLFVLRGMTSRAAARLAARGEACTRIEVEIPYDRSIARLRLADRGCPLREGDPAPRLDLAVDLPAPLSREVDLLRAVKAKLERAVLLAPAASVRLLLPQITPAPRVQLDLSRDAAVHPDNLPALLAELSAEIGPERVGVLSITDAHRPEARSRLVPALEGVGAENPDSRALWIPGEPTRILPEPIPLGRVKRGAVVAVSQRLYAIERIRFVMRLDAVDWWTPSPVFRDYASAWLASGPGERREASNMTRLGARSEGNGSPSGAAWIFVDRTSGEGFLQGWSE